MACINCKSLACQNVLWLESNVKVWHAKMQVLEVSQIMKEIGNKVHPMGQFGQLNCIYQNFTISHECHSAKS